jgi:2-methylcitrate dehydratase PrpD
MRVVQFPSMLKDGSTFGAFAGAAGALLASKGFTGDPIGLVDLLDEKLGNEVWHSLGNTWLIMEQYFKPFPICRWTHPAVLGIQALRKNHPGWTEADVERVQIKAFKEAVSLSCRQPTESDAAQYSLPFVAATALVHGDVGIEHVAAQGLTDERVLFHSDRMELLEDPDYSARFPAQRWSQVEIRLKNGQLLSSGPVTSIGDPASPLPDGFIRQKFMANVGPVLGDERADGLWAAVMDEACALPEFLRLISSAPADHAN